MTGDQSARAHLRAAATVFAAFLVHCSLYPYADWRRPDASTWDYWLGTSILPLRRFFPLDAALNVLAYIPLGYLALASLPITWRRFAWATAAVWLACTGLSGGLELLQAFLPGRISSKLDLICNSVGAAVGLVLGRRILGLSRRRPSAIVRALNDVLARIDWEATLTLGIWLFCLMSPRRVPFAMGPWLGDMLPARFEPTAATLTQWSVVARFLTSTAAFTGALMLGLSQIPPGRRRLPICVLLLLTAGLAGWLLPQAQNVAIGACLLSPLQLWGTCGVASIAAATAFALCVARSDWSRRHVSLLSLVALCAAVACTSALPGSGHIESRPELQPDQRFATYLLSAADGLSAVWSLLGVFAAGRLSQKAS